MTGNTNLGSVLENYDPDQAQSVEVKYARLISAMDESILANPDLEYRLDSNVQRFLEQEGRIAALRSRREKIEARNRAIAQFSVELDALTGVLGVESEDVEMDRLEVEQGFDELEKLFASFGMNMGNKEALVSNYLLYPKESRIPLKDIIEKFRYLADGSDKIDPSKLADLRFRYSKMLGLYCHGDREAGDNELGEIFEAMQVLSGRKKDQQQVPSPEVYRNVISVFSEVGDILSYFGLNIDVEAISLRYVQNQLIPLSQIKDVFKSLSSTIRANWHADLAPLFERDLAAAVGFFANGNEEKAMEGIDSIRHRLSIVSETRDVDFYNGERTFENGNEDFWQAERKKELLTFSEEAAKRANASVDRLAENLTADDRILNGTSLAYPLADYVEFVESLEDLARVKGAFVNKDPNASLEEKKLRMVIFDANILNYPNPFPKVKRLFVASAGKIEIREEVVTIPSSQEEYTSILESAKLAKLYALNEVYLRTGDPKYRKDFEEFQAKVAGDDSRLLNGSLDEAFARDSLNFDQSSDAALSPGSDNELARATFDSAKTVVSEISDEYHSLPQFQVSDPGFAYDKARQLRTDLLALKSGNGNGRFAVNLDSLGSLPEVRAIFDTTVSGYLSNTDIFLKEVIVKNPQSVAFLDAAGTLQSQSKPALLSLQSLATEMDRVKQTPVFFSFEVSKKTGDAPGAALMAALHENARVALACLSAFSANDKAQDGRLFLRHVAGNPVEGLGDDFTKMVKDLELALSKTDEYIENLRKGSQTILSIEPSGTGAGEYFTEVAKIAGVLAIAVATGYGMAAVVKGVVDTALYAGITYSATTKFVASCVIIGAPIGISSTLAEAAIYGNTNTIEDSWAFSKRVGLSVGMMAAYQLAAPVVGAVLGRFADRLSKLTGWTRDASRAFVLETEQSLLLGAHAGRPFAGFRRLFEATRPFGKELSEEMLEEGLEAIALVIADDNPLLGFALGLLPSATARAKSTFLAQNRVFSPIAGVNIQLSDAGIFGQYDFNAKEQMESHLVERGAPEAVLEQFRSTGIVNLNQDGVSINIVPTFAPEGPRSLLMTVKGEKAAKRAGLVFNEATKTYEYKNANGIGSARAFFESQGYTTSFDGDGVLTVKLEGVETFKVSPALNGNHPAVDLAEISAEVPGFTYDVFGSFDTDGNMQTPVVEATSVESIGSLAEALKARGFTIRNTENGFVAERSDFSQEVRIAPEVRAEMQAKIAEINTLVEDLNNLGRQLEQSRTPNAGLVQRFSTGVCDLMFRMAEIGGPKVKTAAMTVIGVLVPRIAFAAEGGSWYDPIVNGATNVADTMVSILGGTLSLMDNAAAFAFALFSGVVYGGMAGILVGLSYFVYQDASNYLSQRRARKSISAKKTTDQNAAATDASLFMNSPALTTLLATTTIQSQTTASLAQNVNLLSAYLDENIQLMNLNDDLYSALPRVDAVKLKKTLDGINHARMQIKSILFQQTAPVVPTGTPVPPPVAPGLYLKPSLTSKEVSLLEAQIKKYGDLIGQLGRVAEVTQDTFSSRKGSAKRLFLFTWAASALVVILWVMLAHAKKRAGSSSGNTAPTQQSVVFPEGSTPVQPGVPGGAPTAPPYPLPPPRPIPPGGLPAAPRVPLPPAPIPAPAGRGSAVQAPAAQPPVPVPAPSGRGSALPATPAPTPLPPINEADLY